MGFHTQPNAWQCGPYALKHALLSLGIVAEEGVLTRAAGADEDGADERDLGRAAARYRCDLGLERYRDAAATRRALAGHLRARTPVLLCVDHWSHWVAAAGMEGEAVVLLDSRVDGVFHVVEWPLLEPRVAYGHAGGRAVFDLHPLVPRRPTPRARFSLARVELLRGVQQRDLARGWGGYLEALLPLSRLPGPQTEWTIGVGDALREYAAGAVDATPTHAGLRSRRHLSHAAFVADTHGLEAGVDGAAALRGVARRIAGFAAAA
jgi:hypothetical protein